MRKRDDIQTDRLPIDSQLERFVAVVLNSPEHLDSVEGVKSPFEEQVEQRAA